MAGVAFGQTRTGRINKDPYYFAAVCSAVGTTLIDGSKLICKAGGTAWFVAPDSTEFSGQWANGQYNSTAVGDKCGVSEWGALNGLLSCNVCNYIASEWFIPTVAQLQNPGYTCRSNYSYLSAEYWSSVEVNSTLASRVGCNNPNPNNKTCAFIVRAYKCVTY